ncbi:hypothetical protein F8M41_017931 [Gigaspora margarita]|uniref:Protein kinase domain-containing protein n=1 Tax=Gigaspora margarita TaxID=4874 RepID=A0A8H4EU97_GIGMA|nr:hypothetical protein F8M41_017931 [Gigaspora margarita]
MIKFYESEPVNYDKSDEDESEIVDYEALPCNSEDDENYANSLSITTSYLSNLTISEEWLKKAISEGHINYIEYNKFTNPIFIGIGGFGTVFKYDWRDIELTVALKCLKVDKSIDEKTIEDFINEVLLLC